VDIAAVIFEIFIVANSVIREAALPDLSLSLQLHSQRVGVASFDELD
jgi:hypothetical protein